MDIEIIAEIAQGYEGNPKQAYLLVKGAIAANADALKMQLVYADELCVPHYPYFDFFRSLEMPDEVWSELVRVTHDAGKYFYFDVYGDRSLALAKGLEADGVKISTTDFYNMQLRKKVFASFDKVFISVGGVPVEDIDKLMSQDDLPSDLTLLHGFQAEPTQLEDNNLMRIIALKKRYPNVAVGFMDHSVGNERQAFQLPLIAMGAGVSCIEKHITLDYLLEIEDYISALSVDRFGYFVKIMKDLEPALGSENLNLSDKEIAYKARAGKVAVAKCNIEAGTKIELAHIELKRVGVESSSEYISEAESLVGKKTSSFLKKDHPFLRSNIL